MLGDPDPTDKDLDTVKEVVERHYQPAHDAGDATEMLTTEQFFAWFEEQVPGLIDRASFRHVLVGLGFRDLRIRSDVYWLLRMP